MEAGTEAVVLVDMGADLDRAIVSALWAMDDDDPARAEECLRTALKRARSQG